MPDIGTIDFTNLSLLQLGTTLLLFAAIDVGVSVALSIIRKDFSGAYVTDYLRTHVLKVAVPILGLGIIGHGVSFGGDVLVPAIPAAGIAASLSLAAYAIATIASVRESFTESKPVPQGTGGLPTVSASEGAVPVTTVDAP
jgi:hypothetical protein